MENVWDYLRQNKLGATVWNGYGKAVEACNTAWNWLIADPARITSIGAQGLACVVVQAGGKTGCRLNGRTPTGSLFRRQQAQ